MLSITEIIGQIKQAVKIADTTPQNPEKKLRELISPIWETFLKEKRVGLNLQIRDELTLANGRADTVFNRLILEYKKPYAIKPDNNKNRQLITQVQGYILDFAKKERFSKDRLLGVAFDGDHFLFMRYVGRWIVDEPLPLTESSLEIFLKNLEKLTSKAALIPKNLIRDFAVGRESRNKVAVDCIKAFYHEINQHGNSGDTKEHVFFEQWTVQFAEVHGTLEQKKIDKGTLFTSYGFSKNEQKDFNVLAFFFALDSYYALLMKLLSYQVVGYYTLSKLTGLPLHDWEELASDDLRRKCDELEEGGIFRSIGVRNFLEGDLFSWYIQAWNDGIYRAIQQIVKYLNDYDPETMEIAPDETRDILKKLYQYLVPKQIRHDLGEYYTPDWLAERTLNQVGYGAKDKDLFKKRLLDPGCGSGTFVILGIKRAKDHAALYGIDPALTLQYITMNIMGFDLNPLAVISARTNYMMAIADLLKYKKGEITIPIYLCDSINPPQARVAHEKTLFSEKKPYEVKTSVGTFLFSQSIINNQRIRQLANLMEDGVKSGQTTDAFLKKVERDLNLTKDELEESDAHLRETFKKLVELENKGINGIWARIIKNAFAPLFVGQFDIVVGNPPWVNWEALPEEYRRILLPINHSIYKLFVHKGLDARHGASKIDICSLMFYVAADKYLKESGKLCFVVTQTLFKSSGSKGFRQFYLHTSGIPLEVLQVDDMVELNPFEGAANRTATICIQKGKTTKYPLPYMLWRKNKQGTIPLDAQFSEVFNITRRFSFLAQPINNNDPLSGWITARKKALLAFQKIAGSSEYIAHKGVDCSANGVFWIDIVKRNGNVLEIINLPEGAKRVIPKTSAFIEKGLVYPLLRGKDTRKWIAESRYYIIVPQDSEKKQNGMAQEKMAQAFPLTLEYLTRFKKELSARKTFQKFLQPSGLPFYSLYDIKEYTFAPFKVVWKEIATGVEAAVIHQSASKLIIPDHKLVFVPFSSEEESYFFCGVMNSSIFRFFICASSISTQIAPKVLKELYMPKYISTETGNQRIARLSLECHGRTAKGLAVNDLEEEIDELAAELWGLTKDELKDIKDSLEELK
ncbi:MAG: N-6 DNA methylase [Nitrospirota bacterium]